ncbi:rolling circle replication-associated protein [Rhodococcoides yunnanense]|uniref:rolling circle replication-associated protein n=1 Tax=Rhodococcoides yunnanense TaxID=278209 RepID=UPI003FA6CEB1
MVTLTYPGKDWELVAPSGKAVKRHLTLWRKRFEREYGQVARFVWKLEFQRRGAPHIHLWLALPSLPGKTGLGFRVWLSRAWTEVVDHPDDGEKRKHLLAGTRVDVLQGMRSCDPKRLAIYFTKHSTPDGLSDKEYQNSVPDLWRQPGNGPGRFWGRVGLEQAVSVVEIEIQDFVSARRILRRWSRTQATYASPDSRFPTSLHPRSARRKVYRRAAKRIRQVNRRRQLFDQGGLKGGFALTNSGSHLGEQLARALHVMHASS